MSFLDKDKLIAGDCFTSTEAMDNLTILCDDFGSRFGGTAGEKQAAEFLKAKLESYGLTNVQMEPFEYTGWIRGTTTLEIIEPIQKVIPCISLPHSPPANVTAELYDAKDGAPSTFADDDEDMSGKVVLADSQTYPTGSKRWVHRNEKYGRSMLNDAKAFIFKNHYPAYGPATGGIGHKGKGAIIPGISVSYEDGSFLQRLVKKHGKVVIKIDTTDEIRPMTSWNITGDIPGNELSDQIVMLGSHYDGHDISQGAQDPASGAVAVLETARLLITHAGKLPCTVRFALWGVEEIGLIGSYEYANRHAAEMQNIRFYFNMDGAGSVKNKGVNLNEWSDIEAMVLDWKEDIALDFKTSQSVHAHSDHYPFLLRGVPTGGLESVPKSTGGRGFGHTRYDTLDKVAVRELQDAAHLASLIAMRVASVPADEWPATHRTAAEVDDLLSLPEYNEVAEFETMMDDYYKSKGM
ncbi:MAG: aminopeptidase YwaD [Cellvibrionaceae bacterium]|jgi:aminopeptidase YwaD